MEAFAALPLLEGAFACGCPLRPITMVLSSNLNVCSIPLSTRTVMVFPAMSTRCSSPVISCVAALDPAVPDSALLRHSAQNVVGTHQCGLGRCQLALPARVGKRRASVQAKCISKKE